MHPSLQFPFGLTDYDRERYGRVPFSATSLPRSTLCQQTTPTVPYLALQYPACNKPIIDRRMHPITTRKLDYSRPDPDYRHSMIYYHGHGMSYDLVESTFSLGNASTSKCEPKPSESYIGLLAKAILDSPEKKLLLGEIYDYMLNTYPYFRSRGSGWRNSVRHNLSLNECFVKVGRSDNGKGHYWSIHPANKRDFERGDYRRRRAQRKVRRYMGLTYSDDDDLDDDVDDNSSPNPKVDNDALDEEILDVVNDYSSDEDNKISVKVEADSENAEKIHKGDEQVSSDKTSTRQSAYFSLNTEDTTKIFDQNPHETQHGLCVCSVNDNIPDIGISSRTETPISKQISATNQRGTNIPFADKERPSTACEQHCLTSYGLSNRPSGRLDTFGAQVTRQDVVEDGVTVHHASTATSDRNVSTPRKKRRFDMESILGIE